MILGSDAKRLWGESLIRFMKTVFIFYVSSATTASLRVLNEASDLVAEGNYEEVVFESDARFEDEVSELTEVFNQMVKKVYKRENKLIKHVTELKIFIDQDRDSTRQI